MFLKQKTVERLIGQMVEQIYKLYARLAGT